LIDAHSLTLEELTPSYARAELLLHRLILEAERHDIAPDVLAWASDLHAHVVAQPSALLASRYVERLCARLCGEHERQLIFVFDAFDDLWRTADARIFLLLRNLRDQFKYRVGYLIFSGNRLGHIDASLPAAEPFLNLFIAHEFGLGMLSSTDAYEALMQVSTRNLSHLEDRQAEVIVRLSGGHPGLLRAIFWALRDAPAEPDLIFDPATLLSISSISTVCARIWDHLSIEEQHLLRLCARDLPQATVDHASLTEMRFAGLIIQESNTLFSSLLTEYVLERTRGDMDGIVVDASRRQVWVDGVPLERRLGPMEFALIRHLGQHAGDVCTMQDLHQALYPEEMANAAGDVGQRLDRILGRLRSAIGPRSHVYLIRHPKIGVQLTQGHVIGGT
jgi:DNA-binding winged helix-turn-helix (wHTH) protein